MVSTSPRDNFQANRLVFDAKNKMCEFGLMVNWALKLLHDARYFLQSDKDWVLLAETATLSHRNLLKRLLIYGLDSSPEM
jgi:hypothetical protein